MNILVTGGAGYVGSVLVERLFQTGSNKVVIFDDMSTAFRHNVNPGAVLVKNTVLNYSMLCETLKKHKIDVVVHMAAKTIVSESVTQPEHYFDVNAIGTSNLIRAMKVIGVSRLVFISSAAVYGNVGKEIYEETDLPQPCNPYGQSKLIGEWMIQNAFDNEPLFKYAILRPFNIGGASDSNNYGMMNPHPSLLIPCITDSLIRNEKFNIYGNTYKTTDHTAIRDYVHVSDVANAIVAAISYTGRASGGIFNICSGKGTSVLEVYNAATEAIGRKPNFDYKSARVGDPDKLVGSNKLAKSKLKWEPEHMIQSMVISDYIFRSKHVAGENLEPKKKVHRAPVDSKKKKHRR